MTKLATIVCFSLFSMLSACTSKPVKISRTPLLQYLEEFGYTPFNPPRAADGLGTIIFFDHGRESIAASRERCLPNALVPSLAPDERAVALLSGSYSINRANNLEVTLAKELTERVAGVPLDLGGILSSGVVQTVEIEFIDPFRDRIERLAARSYIRGLDSRSECLTELLSPSSYIIHSVIGAKGIRYKFIGNGGQYLKLNAELARVLKLAPVFEQKWTGDFKMDVRGEILIGYRLWKAATLSGISEPSLDVEEMTAEEVRAIRAKSEYLKN